MTTTSQDTADSIVVPAHRDPTEYLRALAERDREAAIAQASPSVAGSAPVAGVSPRPRRGRGLVLVIALVAAVAVTVVAWSGLRGERTELPLSPTETAAPILPPASLTSTAEPLGQPVSPSVQTHVVEAGDTLERIAHQYGSTLAALLEVNDLRDPDRLLVGQIILVPVERSPSDMSAN